MRRSFWALAIGVTAALFLVVLAAGFRADPNAISSPLLHKPAAAFALRAIDGNRTIADIVLESRSSTFIVSSTVHTLIRSGHVRAVQAGAGKAAKVEQETAPFEEFSEADEVTVLLKRAQESLKTKDYEKSQRLLKAAENLDANHARVRSAIKGAEAVILAGEPDKSRLIQAIRYDGALKMPPAGKLRPEEIAALTAWVKIGAPWPETKPPVGATKLFWMYWRMP